MSNIEIVMRMSRGDRAAKSYFKDCERWIGRNLKNLSMLWKEFQAESNTTMEWYSFCLGLFNETHEGQSAALKHFKKSEKTLA